MRIVHQFTDGDAPVILEQHEDGSCRFFRVTYKETVRGTLPWPDAAEYYGRCVMHSLLTAGKIKLLGD